MLKINMGENTLFLRTCIYNLQITFTSTKLKQKSRKVYKGKCQNWNGHFIFKTSRPRLLKQQSSLILKTYCVFFEKVCVELYFYDCTETLVLYILYSFYGVHCTVYYTVRGQSNVWRLPKHWPPTTSPPGERVYPTAYGAAGEGHTGGGSIVWKTPDTALYNIYVSTLCCTGTAFAKW